jgi:hypothetical protein
MLEAEFESGLDLCINQSGSYVKTYPLIRMLFFFESRSQGRMGCFGYSVEQYFGKKIGSNENTLLIPLNILVLSNMEFGSGPSHWRPWTKYYPTDEGCYLM